MKRLIGLLLIFILLIITVSACAGAPVQEAVGDQEGESAVEVEKEAEAPMGEAPAAEEPEEAPPGLNTPLPTATQAAQPTLVPTALATSYVEARLIEVEWPEQMYLGDSDVVRMALVPSEKGYTLTTEFPDHTTTTQDVPIVRPEGYELSAVGRLIGVGFSISPTEEQVSSLPVDHPVIWHWSFTPLKPGQQRLTASLLLRWVPLPGKNGIPREAVAYSKGLDVRVNSFFGLSRSQTLQTAFVGLAIGGSLIVLAVISGFSLPGKKTSQWASLVGSGKNIQIRKPNRSLQIEIPSGLILSMEEQALLQSLFYRYHRLIVQREFLSGYSGARTFLLIPILPNGRADAPTIAKLGPRTDIEREYLNYETFVKRTLPPVTARIQATPVGIKNGEHAVLQYTFIGEPGSEPESLRQALLKDPNPELLARLFETFGPNWWMQSSPWTFRVSQEYDRLLPPHWMVEPNPDKGTILKGSTSPAEVKLTIGDLISPRAFTAKKSNTPRDYLTLQGKSAAGQPPLRLRWMSETLPKTASGQVIASRMDLLRSYVVGFDLLGLPNPIEKLPDMLNETILGSRTVIHGDLNLENVLIGPGGMIWLIDFATTREGHPLMDLAHLEAEIITHVIAPQITDAKALMELLKLLLDHGHPPSRNTVPDASVAPLYELLFAHHQIAFKTLANPSQPREYWVAFYLSCLGALKYRNLDPHQKYFLYLTAANLVNRL